MTNPPLFRDRNFFGPVAVTRSRDGTKINLTHGRTLHGMQLAGDLKKARRVPTAYYFPTGPAGQVFEHLGPRWGRGKIAVVGLGAGTLASYGQPGQEWTFFEIDPIVVQVATKYFSFLESSRARWGVKLVDGRLGLAQEPDGHFDLIELDAFSSDSIPTHLVTREALALYRSKLTAEGILLCNISNRYLNLAMLLAGVGEANGLVARVQFDYQMISEEERLGKQSSFWVVLARDTSHLGPIAQDSRWFTVPSGKQQVWTDEYSNILSIFEWRD
jgi:spermidine synthase